MNYQIPISHELIHENVTEFYSVNFLYDFRKDFDEIVSIEKVEWHNKNMLKVIGTIHLYGYDNFTTAINECKEELGIELSKNELCLVYSDRIKNCFVETFYCKKN